MPTGPHSPTDPQENSPAKVSYVIAESGDHGQRVDNFLMRVLKDVPRSLVYRILRTGEVRVNGKRAKPEHRVRRCIIRSLPRRGDSACRRHDRKPYGAWSSVHGDGRSPAPKGS